MAAAVDPGRVIVGAALLSLPFATPGPAGSPLIDALLTAPSAVCATGLVTVEGRLAAAADIVPDLAWRDV